MNKNISDFIERLFRFNYEESATDMVRFFYCIVSIVIIILNAISFIIFVDSWFAFRSLIVLAVYTMIMYLIFKKTKWEND